MKLQSVLSALEKKHKDLIKDLSKVEFSLQRFYLSSPQLNYALGGSWIDGRIYEFHGPESSGKTLLSMKIANDIQQRETKNVIIFVDFEHTFSLDFYKNIFPNMKWDQKNFIYLDPLNGEEAFDVVEELIKTGEVGLVIWDSVATTPTLSQLSKETGAADFGGTARLMAAGLKKINPYVSKFKTSIIFVNQVRAAIDAYSFESIPGGRALPFYASARFRISRVDDIKEKGIVVGLNFKCVAKKNKIGIPKRQADLSFHFTEGFDAISEYAEFITSLGILHASGAWIKHPTDETLKWNGKTKLIEWMKEKSNEDMVQSWINTVNALLIERTQSDVDSDEEDEFQDDFQKAASLALGED